MQKKGEQCHPFFIRNVLFYVSYACATVSFGNTETYDLLSAFLRKTTIPSIVA